MQAEMLVMRALDFRLVPLQPPSPPDSPAAAADSDDTAAETDDGQGPSKRAKMDVSPTSILSPNACMSS